MKKIVLISAFLFAGMGLNAQLFRPLDQMSDVERSVFLAERFWDGFSFPDTMSLHNPQFRGAVQRYLQAISLADLPTIQRSLVETIKKADTNERMWRYFIEVFDFYLNDALSEMREERWIVPVWQQMLQSKWTTFSDNAKLNFFLEMAAKNPVGSIATDLDFVDIQGRKGKLSEIDAELLLVYFYIPGCPQCKMTIEWIESDTAYQDIHKAGILQALAFYPEKDMAIFRGYRNTVPSTWINSREPDDRSQLEEEGLYQMRGAPTIYLLDRNKNVILKDARMDLLFKEFHKAREKHLK
ncbi:MAG: DUF5106 domain-containing protein [Bacteroidales bacterium]|jgi:hypothetical protein|nr:DUF5106 domain-containing protein [Bacteroidales bacterium]